MKLEVLVSFEGKSAKLVKIQLEISNIHQIKGVKHQKIGWYQKG